MKKRCKKVCLIAFYSGHRKWNTLAFRGRLMSLLAPARGMPVLRPRQEVCKRWPQRPYLACLPLKLGGFSRPSLITHSGVSLRPHLPQDKEGYGSDTSHAEKAGCFFKSLAYSIYLDRLPLSFTTICSTI